MKALFVGLGSIGQRHLRNLIKLCPEIELLAVRYKRLSPVLDNLNNVIEGISISDLYNIKEFDSLSLALDKKPDIVFITNPTSHHIKVAKKALLLGCFIFIEKPLSNEWNGIDELIEIEKKIGSKRISVGYQFRFHPALKLIKSLLTKKRIGNLIGVRFINGEYMPNWHPYENYQLSYAGRRDLGGGAIVTQIHDFDMALWLFGKPTKVFSVGGHLSDLKIDVEDSVQILIEFMQNSKLFPLSINLDYLQWPPERSISITGDKGSIKCDLIKMEVIINDRINDRIERKTFSDFDRNDLFIEEMTNFLEFFAGNEAPTVDLENATGSLHLALAAKESMNSGKTIDLI